MDENELIANYELIRLDRGWSYDTLANYLESEAPGLAQVFRAKAEADADPTPAPEPEPTDPTPVPEPDPTPQPDDPKAKAPRGRRAPATEKA